MTRQEHLKFCKKCTNRKMDLKVGLVCKLTGRQADFEQECSTFELDPEVKERIDDTEAIEHSEVLRTLSDENIKKFTAEQNFSQALMTGIAVGIIGAILWATITVITEYQIGYMAIGIGAIVGLSMRIIGKGIDQIFGIAGGVISLISCLLGNILSIIGFMANGEGIGYFEMLTVFDYSQLLPILSETFSPIDLLFYGFAASFGYKFSFRTFTEKDLHELEKK